MEFYINTFHKCGSNWFRPIFRDLAEVTSSDYIPHSKGKMKVNQEAKFGGSNIYHIFAGGNIHKLEKVFPDYSLSNVLFFVRSPKDALVSQYFSWRNSHKNNDDEIIFYREKLNQLEPLEGMKLLVEDNVFRFANQFNPWLLKINELGADWSAINLFKYEDFKSSFHDSFNRLTKVLDVKVSYNCINKIQDNNSFVSRSGRETGEENPYSHFRKGVVGDYKEYFDSELEGVFNKKYSALMQKLGY